MQIDEFAAPLLALVVDRAVYDVAKLEQLWGIAGRFGSADFHQRVVGARGAGLEMLEARLLSGDRPTEARLAAGDFLPLAPCDTDRAAYFQMAPCDLDLDEPAYRQRDCRSLMGDAQPVACPEPMRGSPDPWLEPGLAVLVADDLYRARAREAERAILGVTLVIDWTSRPDRWPHGHGPEASSQLGSVLVTGPAAREVMRGRWWLEVDGVRRADGAVGAWRFSPAESIAYLSQHARLRAGDVVGLGCFAAGRTDVAWGSPVTVGIERLLTLSGSAAIATPPTDWRSDAPVRTAR